MSTHSYRMRSTINALETAAKHDGAHGAFAGGRGTLGMAILILGLFGLALTPVGMVVVALVGAIAGGVGFFKKMRGKS